MQELSCDAFFLVFYEQLVFLCVTEEWVKKKLQISFLFFFCQKRALEKGQVCPMFIASRRAGKKINNESTHLQVVIYGGNVSELFRCI